jgi:hypothetical protein
VFLESFHNSVIQSRREVGCIAFDFYEVEGDPTKFVFVQRWKDQTAVSPCCRGSYLRQWPVACIEMILVAGAAGNVRCEVANQLAAGGCFMRALLCKPILTPSAAFDSLRLWARTPAS